MAQQKEVKLFYQITRKKIKLDKQNGLPSCEAPAEGFRSPPGDPNPTPGCNRRGASKIHKVIRLKRRNNSTSYNPEKSEQNTVYTETFNYAVANL